jgi:hypothetical protein
MVPVVLSPVSGQAPKAVPAKTARTSGKWIPPRTPWGDPDIQGWFTNVCENGTPLERPDQCKDRKLEDIKGEELAQMRRGLP